MQTTIEYAERSPKLGFSAKTLTKKGGEKVNIEKIGAVVEVVVAAFAVLIGFVVGPLVDHYYLGLKTTVLTGAAWLAFFGGLKFLLERVLRYRKRCSACLQTVPGKARFCPVCGSEF